MDKLFAFDLDGTLVHTNEKGLRQIPEPLLSTVKELMAKEHVIVATGRRFRTATQILSQLPELDYIVCHNGQIVRSASGEILFRSGISWQDGLKISESLKSLGEDPVFVFDGEFKNIDFIYEPSLETSRKKDLVRKFPDSTMEIESFSMVEPEMQNHFLEVSCISKYERLLIVQEKLAKLLPEGIRAIVVENCGYSGFSVLEVFHKKTSKWSGIEFIKKTLGASKVIAVGDDENDIEMLEYSDIGVSMGHSRAHVKNAANEIVQDPHELSDFLRKRFLG